MAKLKTTDTIKKSIDPRPIMEQFNKYHQQGLQCSIDRGAPPVPMGAREYFNNHGYMIIKNLCDLEELYHPIILEKGKVNIDEKKLNELDHFLKGKKI